MILIELETATLKIKDDDYILWFIVEQKAILHLTAITRTSSSPCKNVH